MSPRNRLFVLAPSHYCERARWALDHAGVAYTEERWAVGLHLAQARRLAPGTTLPILATADTVIQGSGAILDWVGLAGGDPALERHLEQRVGVLVRQFVYAGTLGVPGSGIREILMDGVPAGQAQLGRLLWPATRRLMVSAMNARPALLPDLERQLDAELDRFEERLAGRRHLVGDAFGRADLTAASLLAPLARPAAIPLYRRTRLPPPLEAAFVRWGARPGLRWVEHVYAEHRARTPRAATA